MRLGFCRKLVLKLIKTEADRICLRSETPVRSSKQAFEVLGAGLYLIPRPLWAQRA